VTIDPSAFVGLAVGNAGNALFLGLFGVLAVAILVLHADHTLRTFGGDGVCEAKTTCDDCGARIAVATERCGHCGETLTDGVGEPPRHGWSER
jgi:hypothetical protein